MDSPDRDLHDPRRPDGSLTKASSESVFAKSRLTPLETHDSVAYHPDGTTFAVAGSDGIAQGIYISKNDGTGPQPLALSDVGVVITEMLFTNDARWLVFVADHTADDLQDGYHVHSVFTEPFELEDGRRRSVRLPSSEDPLIS